MMLILTESIGFILMGIKLKNLSLSGIAETETGLSRWEHWDHKK
jgi:hypothetical protein